MLGFAIVSPGSTRIGRIARPDRCRNRSRQETDMPASRTPSIESRRQSDSAPAQPQRAGAGALLATDGRATSTERPGTTDDRRPPASRPSLAARELMSNLPYGMLQATAERFPHVIEALARDWAEPSRMNATLDEVVFDARGNRSGFPSEVLLELAELRACYARWVGPRTQQGR
jgi:hypothetical protein